MREKGLCESCVRINDRCWGKVVQEIAQDAKKTPFEKHTEITKRRIEARQDLCSQINTEKLNPDYPGKELL